MSEKETRGQAIQERIDALVAEHHEKAQELTRAEADEYRQKIKAGRRELQELLSEDADGCAHCGRKPHIIRQSAAIAGGHVLHYYSAGCLVEDDNRIKDPTLRGLDETIAAWNEQQAELASA